MKKTLSLLFFTFISLVTIAQSSLDLDQKLSVKFSKNEIKSLKENNFEKYNLYHKSFSKGITVAPYNTENIKNKDKKYESLNITLKEGEFFNYLKYDLDLKNESQYFLINNGQTIVLIKGIEVLNLIK